MVSLAWLDFTKHNATTGENIRAFSVNHPVAGRLVIIKGISNTYASGMGALGFSNTKDGSWVIKASQLNIHSLQTNIVPLLGIKNVQLSDIDLTEQFVKQSVSAQHTPARETASKEEQPKQVPHPGLNWLSKSTRLATDGSHKVFEGILPKTVAQSLWDHLEDSADKEELLNGQTIYQGEIDGNAFIIVKRQQLLGSAQRIQYFEADTVSQLPNLSSRIQAPAIFQISDAVKSQLDEIGTYYGFNTGTLHNVSFTPSRRLNLEFAQQSLNLSDGATGVINQVRITSKTPLVIASSEYHPGVTIQELEEAFGGESTQTIIDSLESSDWLEPSIAIKSEALINLSAFNRIALSRGADALVYYAHIGNAISGRDPFISDSKVAMYLKPLTNTVVDVITTETLHNMSKVPEGFRVLTGEGTRSGQYALEHVTTGELVRKENVSWYGSIVDAVESIERSENAFFVNPTPEDIDSLLDSVYIDPVDVIAYRGEHGSIIEGQPLRSRLGSISFGSQAAAKTYAQSPNDKNATISAPRVIEARLTISKPVINDSEDPFIDFSVIISAVGTDKTLAIAKGLDHEIQLTNNFADLLEKHGLDGQSVSEVLVSKPELLSQLYVDAHYVFDNREWVQWFSDAGFDGAVHAGKGATAEESEYKIFNASQAEILSVQLLEPEIIESQVDDQESVSLELTEIADDVGNADLATPVSTTQSPVRESQLIEQALDELSGAKSFKDANIEVIKENSEWVIHHNGNPLSRFIGEFNRENVESALIRDLGVDELTNEQIYARIEGSDNKLEVFKGILDPVFKKRYSDVKALLIERGYSASDRGTMLFSPSNESTVRAEFKFIGDENHVVGLNYHVGPTTVKDSLMDGCDTIAAKLHDLVEAAELQEGIVETAIDEILDIKRIDITKFESIDAVSQALNNGKEIISGNTIYSVVESTAGWVVVENQGGVNVTKGGDPRGGGYSRQEAIKNVLNELDHHFEVAEAQVPVVQAFISQPELSPNVKGPIIGSDLFSSEPLPLGKPVILRRAASPKQFLVCGDGLIKIDHLLQDAGGKFIKKYGGYRFDKSSERGIRTLLTKAEGEGQISINDEIRIPFNLKVNAKLADPLGRPFKVTEIARTKDGGLNVVLLLDQNNSIIIALTHTTAQSLEGDFDVTISNWDYLNTEYPLLGSQTEAVTADQVIEEPQPNAAEPALMDEPKLELITADDVNQLIDDSDITFPEFTVFRGTTVERLGKNTQNEFIYGNDDGIRYIKTDDGIVHAESPFVTESGEFVAPNDRENRFKLLEELQNENQARDNIVPLRTIEAPGQDQPSKILTNEEFDKEVEHTGITSSVLDDYFRAYSKLRLAQESTEDNEANAFTVRRLEVEFGKKGKLIQQVAANNGYGVSMDLLEDMAEASYAKQSRVVNKISNLVYSMGITRAIESRPHVHLEDALTLGIDIAHGLPPYWVNAKLKQCIQREDYSTYAVFISKVYGSSEELAHAIATVQSTDAEQIKSLAEELQTKYEKTRALVELPSMIQDTHKRFNDYRGASPIPRRNLEELLADHYRNLAMVQFDIPALEITEDDIQIFRTSSSHSASIEQLALKHQLSYEAGRLYCNRIEKILEQRYLEEFANSPATIALQEAARIVQQHLPEEITVRSGIKPNDSRIWFRFGAGVIAVSRPYQRNEDQQIYSLYFTYDNSRFSSSEFGRTASIDYEGLPTPEVIAKDLLSFAQLSHTQSKVYLSPIYGEKFDSLDSNSKYNLTAIAKLVREDIKAAIANGSLPKGIKVSVRKDTNSIYLTVTKVPDGFQVLNPKYAAHLATVNGWAPPPDGIDRYSHEASALLATLKNYLNAYNFDKSDIQSDYFHTNYYSREQFDSELEDADIKSARENPVDPDADNAIYRLLNESSFRHVTDFINAGITYVGSRRVGLQFNSDGKLIIAGNLTRAKEKVINQDGLIVEESKDASEILRLAYTAIGEAYHLENMDFYRETRDQTTEAQINTAPTSNDSGVTEPVLLNDTALQEVDTDEIGTTEPVLNPPSVEVVINQFDVAFFEKLEGAIKHMEGLGAVPLAYASPIENHFNRAYLARGKNALYEMVLTAGFSAGEANGVLIHVKNEQNSQDAVVTAATAFEEYAKGAFANMQADGMADSLIIINALEQYGGRHRFTSNLINNAERKIAAKGIAGVNDYFQGLTETYKDTLLPALLIQQTVSIPAIDGLCKAGTFSLAQLDNSSYVWGAELSLTNGNNIVSIVRGDATPYETPQDAAAAFIKTVSHLGADSERIRSELFETFAEVVPVNRNDANHPIPDLTKSEAYTLITKLRKLEAKYPERIANASSDEEVTQLKNEQRETEISLREAIVVHVLHLIESSSPEVMNLDSKYVTDLAADYPELRRAWNAYHLDEASNGIAADETMIRIWVNDANLSGTHEVVDSSIKVITPVIELDSLGVTEVVNTESLDASYTIDISDVETDTKTILANHARMAGGLIDDDQLHFSNKDNLHQFGADTDIKLSISNFEETEPSRLDTTTRNGNISRALKNDLDKAGYMQTQEDNVWVAATDNDGALKISFFEGIARNSLEVKIQYSNFGRQEKDHIVDLDSDIRLDALEAAINEHLTALEVDHVRNPVFTPTLDEMTGEMVCKVLLGANLNIEETSKKTWVVSGDTYRYRNQLSSLGGAYSNTDAKKPIWEFKEAPAAKLAVFISTKVEPAEPQTEIDGFTLTVSYNDTEHHFETILKKGDNEQQIILGAHASLSKARVSILSSITDSANFQTLWNKVYPAPELTNGTLAREESLENERPTISGTPGEPTAGRHAPSAQSEQREMAERTDTGIPGEVAAKVRGNDGQSRGSNYSTRREPSEQPGSESGRSPTNSNANSDRATPTDGGFRRNTDISDLFNLNEARQSGSDQKDNLGENTLNAINTLITLRREQRTATPEEKLTLSKMVGFGAGQFTTGSTAIFGGYSHNDLNSRIRTVIYKNFTREEQESLRNTVLTAFYTPETVTGFMWDALEHFGLSEVQRPLQIVDPGVGTGNFIGTAPTHIRLNADFHGIECDKVTAEIASHLYPEAKIINKEFQHVQYTANSKDLVIGNPPYSDVRTFNPRTGKREVLHDLFLRESIAAVRPGGIVSFVTSSGTLDKKGDNLRRDVASKADLVAAFRLPTSAFKADAGTEVMTDILFFRKRKEGEEPLQTNWINSVIFSEGEDDNNDVNVNEYFIENPNHVLGELRTTSGRFGRVLTCVDNGQPLKEQLTACLNLLPAIRFEPEVHKDFKKVTNKVQEKMTVSLGANIPHGSKLGELILGKEGDIQIIRYDGSSAEYYSEAAPYKKANEQLIKDYIGLRNCARELIDLERKPETDELNNQLVSLRETLNTQYDNFVSQYGPLSRKVTSRILRQDPGYYFTAQLEHYDKDTDTARKSDVLNRRVIQAEQLPRINSPLDAAYYSMSNVGHIDPSMMEELLGNKWETIREELGESIFLDPKSGQYLSAAIYLSGDVIEKIEAAERALITNPEMELNVAALTKVIPKPISITDIRIKIGATWIPESILSNYVQETLKATSNREKCYVSYNDTLKTWHFKVTDMVLRNASARNTVEFGTPDYPFHKLFKHCLEQTRPTVTVEMNDGTRVIDAEKTQAARDKQELIEERFVAMILNDTKLAMEAEKAYNYRMNRFVPMNPDGKYLTFPGLTTELKGKPFAFGSHQLGVIERAITSDVGTLIAHEAGGGKTISTTSICIKAKQLGIAKKPLIAVPNHMLIQYTIEALDLFPNARILTVSKDDLDKASREQFAYKCLMNDWDLVICTHEQFSKMKMPEWYITNSMNNEISDLEEMIIQSQGDTLTIKQLERQKKSLKEKLDSEIARIAENQDDIDFTELGFDWVAYDEAHYLKNRAFPTKNSNLAGVQSLTSQRARDAEMKFDYIRQARGDSKGVLLATGTPLSNTIGEIMVILRYTAPDILERAGIHNFDDFIANYGETKIHVELTADGSGYQLKERLSGFHNIPELMKMFVQVADIKMGDQLDLKRPNVNRVTRVSEMSPEQRMFMDWLAHRARAVKTGSVAPHEDNMLKIYSDLQTISIDPRLYHHKLQDLPTSKINQEIESIFEEWEKGHENLNTQIMFIDRFQNTVKTPNGFTPKGKPKFKTEVVFNLIDDIKNKLILKGIPAEQIGSIHDTKTDEDKEEFFSQIRKGNIRLVFASTAKMGVGTNVQTRGKDLRHLSYPMRAIDIEQRNKRFERQGNMHSEINLHYPTTKDSGDLALLQMIERKDKMTKQIMSCDFENMSRSFDEDFTPSYEDIMAVTTGNTLIKEKLETDSLVDKLRRQRKAHSNQCYTAKVHHLGLTEHRIPDTQKYIAISERLAKKIPLERIEQFQMKIKGMAFNQTTPAGVAIHALAKKMVAFDTEREIGEYLGYPLSLGRNKIGMYYLKLDVDGSQFTTDITDNPAFFPSKIGHTIKARILGIEEGKAMVKTYESEAKSYLELSQQPFPHEADLIAAEERLSELNIELAKEDKNNKQEVLDGLHPFEILLAKLDGEEIEMKSNQKFGLLSDEEIMSAMDADMVDDSTREKVKELMLTR